MHIADLLSRNPNGNQNQSQEIVNLFQEIQDVNIANNLPINCKRLQEIKLRTL